MTGSHAAPPCAIWQALAISITRSRSSMDNGSSCVRRRKSSSSNSKRSRSSSRPTRQYTTVQAPVGGQVGGHGSGGFGLGFGVFVMIGVGVALAFTERSACASSTGDWPHEPCGSAAVTVIVSSPDGEGAFKLALNEPSAPTVAEPADVAQPFEPEGPYEMSTVPPPGRKFAPVTVTLSPAVTGPLTRMVGGF